MMYIDFKFEVTKEDIKAGLRESCRNCPVARGASRALRLPVGFNGKHLYVSGNYDEYASTSRNTVLFAKLFDSGTTPVEMADGFEVTARIPKAWIKECSK